jgi:DNA-binding response OmpR family regulator
VNPAGRSSENPGRDAEVPTVLIVEDELLLRMGVADYLRGCGYRVVEADNGDEAVSVLESDARIDVVFTDITMPGTLNGFGLAQWVRRKRPEVRVILTSGISRTAQEVRDLCAHGSLVAKPYDYGEIERHIRALLALP